MLLLILTDFRILSLPRFGNYFWLILLMSDVCFIFGVLLTNWFPCSYNSTQVFDNPSLIERTSQQWKRRQGGGIQTSVQILTCTGRVRWELVVQCGGEGAGMVCLEFKLSFYGRLPVQRYICSLFTRGTRYCVVEITVC